MFSWFKKKPAPPPVSTSNPGKGHSLNAVFTNSERTWEEQVDLLSVLSEVLSRMGHAVTPRASWLEMDQLTLRPQLVSFAPRHPAGTQTSTTIEVCIRTDPPAGFFEFQHASGSCLEDSFRSGFQSWADLDLPVILDFMRGKTDSCMSMELPISKAEKPGTHDLRQVLLGPTAHCVQYAEAESPGDHDFCPCCLLTKSFEAFRPLIENPAATYAIRFFAVRNADGSTEADCRVNGEDFEEGSIALLRYIDTWPVRGFEFRKQFAMIFTKQTT